MSLSSLFSDFSAFGFSGGRVWNNPVAPLSAAAAAVPSGSAVFVGCARGVDSYFRRIFPNASVLSVASGCFGAVSRGAFAARSVACVNAVSGAGGLWVSFPISACPAGLLPSSSSSRAFCGSGSGSWASLSFAVGSGVPCVVFLGSLPVPSGWGFAPVSGSPGWFSVGLSSPVQLSLF